MIKTYTQNFQLDLPEALSIGSKHIIKLTVKDNKGLTSTDSFEIEIIEPEESEIVEQGNIVEEIDPEIKEPEKKQNDPETIITIQSLSVGDLVPMQAEAIDNIIYHMIRDMGMRDVKDPNQYRPDTVYTILEADSVNPAVTATYNTECLTDSCAAQNAVMEKAMFCLGRSIGITHYRCTFSMQKHILKNHQTIPGLYLPSQ